MAAIAQTRSLRTSAPPTSVSLKPKKHKAIKADDIIAFFQGLLEQLEKGFDDLCRLRFCEQVLGKQLFGKVGFARGGQWDFPTELFSNFPNHSVSKRLSTEPGNL